MEIKSNQLIQAEHPILKTCTGEPTQLILWYLFSLSYETDIFQDNGKKVKVEPVKLNERQPKTIALSLWYPTFRKCNWEAILYSNKRTVRSTQTLFCRITPQPDPPDSYCLEPLSHKIWISILILQTFQNDSKRGFLFCSKCFFITEDLLTVRCIFAQKIKFSNERSRKRYEYLIVTFRQIFNLPWRILS